MPLFTLTPAPVLLYAFLYRDELTGKWTKARYRAEHHVIAERFRETEWQIEGPPERRWPLRIRPLEPARRRLAPGRYTDLRLRS